MRPIAVWGRGKGLEDVLEGGAFVVLDFLDGLFELFAGLVPLVDASEEVLLVHLAAHDQVLVPQVVQLLAGTVGAVLQVQHQRLHVLLLQFPHFQHLLPLVQDDFAVQVLSFHLLDLGLEGCWRKKKAVTDAHTEAGEEIFARLKNGTDSAFRGKERRDFTLPAPPTDASWRWSNTHTSAHANERSD